MSTQLAGLFGVSVNRGLGGCPARPEGTGEVGVGRSWRPECTRGKGLKKGKMYHKLSL